MITTVQALLLLTALNSAVPQNSYRKCDIRLQLDDVVMVCIQRNCSLLKMGFQCPLDNTPIMSNYPISYMCSSGGIENNIPNCDYILAINKKDLPKVTPSVFSDPHCRQKKTPQHIYKNKAKNNFTKRAR